MMSTKDYTLIARAMRDEYELTAERNHPGPHDDDSCPCGSCNAHWYQRSMIARLANDLHNQNPRFDYALFMEAATGEKI